MIHHIFANKSNIGDWLSARGIQALIGNRQVQEHFCDEQFAGEALNALSKASDSDFIIIGGGGLFMDYFVPFWEGFLRIADNLRFCIWGVGYCDLKTEASRPPQALLEDVIQRSRLCIVRDELTRRLMSSCKLSPAVPCPSINVIEPPKRPSRGFLHVDSYDVVGSEIYEAMCAYAREFSGRTRRPYHTSNNLIPETSELALRLNLERYAAADLILSSRLHGCIIGLAMGRKVLAVSGDNKVESLMQSAGLDDWVCDINDIDSLPYRLENLPSQPSAGRFIEWARSENRVIAGQVTAAIEAW